MGLIGATTRRGFTGHEHLDSVNLIHMNGRVYDPWLGQFLSADPVDGNVHLSQRLARYSYVMNSPHKFTDPTGFDCVSDNNLCNERTETQKKTIEEIITRAPRIEKASPPAWVTVLDSGGAAAYWQSAMASMGGSGWAEAANWLANPAIGLMGQGLGGTLNPLPPDISQALIEEATLGDAVDAALIATGGVVAGGIRKVGVSAGSEVSRASRNRIRQLIRHLSRNDRQNNGLSQEKLDQLRRIAESVGGRLRVERGAQGSSAGKNHAQVEGQVGGRGRHVWLQDGVE